MNANYKGKCGALLKQPCWFVFFQICSVIIFGDNSHVLLWPVTGGRRRWLASWLAFCELNPCQSEHLWAVLTSPDLRHTRSCRRLVKAQMSGGAADKTVVQCRPPAHSAPSEASPRPSTPPPRGKTNNKHCFQLTRHENSKTLGQSS